MTLQCQNRNDLDFSENVCDIDYVLPEQRTISNIHSTAISSSFQPNEMQDNEFRKTIRSLNSIQRKTYEIILKWCREKVKSMTSIQPYQVEPIYPFISGGAGTGKSHLIKSVYQTILKTF